MKRIICIALVLMLLSIFINLKYHASSRVIDSLIYDNKKHYLTCEELPSRVRVDQILYSHQEVISQVKQIESNIAIEIGDGDNQCETTADIVIYFSGHEQRKQIEKIIDTETFFGIPYRLINI